MTFLEAASFKCAILSSVNPDDFASNFGYWARQGDSAKGLQSLLSNEKWKPLGEAAHQYVKQTHELNVVVDKHLQAYEQLLRMDSYASELSGVADSFRPMAGISD